MGRFNLTDEEWAIVAPLLPTQVHGPRRRNDRNFLNGIFYILRAGALSRDFPTRYSPPSTVYNRYNGLGERCVW